jgi:ribonuclease P protein subunit POP4
MKVTSAFVQGEFIGLKAKVVESSNADNVGINGTVVDETRNTFLIRQKNVDKMVVKDSSVFHFTMPDGTIVEVDGKVILGRPEDRLKKKIKRRW